MKAFIWGKLPQMTAQNASKEIDEPSDLDENNDNQSVHAWRVCQLPCSETTVSLLVSDIRSGGIVNKGRSCS